MKNDTPNQPSISAGSPSAVDQNALNERTDNLILLAQRRLAMPTSEAICAAHSRAMDALPETVPGVDCPCVTLIDPAARWQRDIEPSDAFSPQQLQRLTDVLNGAKLNPQLAAQELLQRAGAALDRVPLGRVVITSNAIASAIPPETLFEALRLHRRSPEDRPADQPPSSEPSWVTTSYHEPECAWPKFVVATQPDRAVTLIALPEEFTAFRVEQIVN